MYFFFNMLVTFIAGNGVLAQRQSTKIIYNYFPYTSVIIS